MARWRRGSLNIGISSRALAHRGKTRRSIIDNAALRATISGVNNHLMNVTRIDRHPAHQNHAPAARASCARDVAYARLSRVSTYGRIAQRGIKRTGGSSNDDAAWRKRSKHRQTASCAHRLAPTKRLNKRMLAAHHVINARRI